MLQELAGISLWPIGRTIVPRDEADLLGRGPVIR
jgi:uncharacterized membrane protein YccF (DUF307 family)